MKFKLSIDSCNAACTVDYLPGMLKKVIAKIEAGHDIGKVIDENGNTVGKFNIVKENEDGEV